MSLINKMLQDLDVRRAVQGQPAVTESPQAATNVRPVKPARAGSEIFWRVMAAIMIVAVLWVAWVVWQIMPRSLVTELAVQSAKRPSPSPAKSAPAPAAPAPPSASAPGVAPAPAAGKELPENMDMLRLATEMATPPAARPILAAPPPKPPEKQAAAPRRQAQAPKAADRAVVATAKPPTAPPQSRVGKTAPDSGRIEKRVDATPRQRAESGFRQAMVLVNQGRMAEGMDGLRAALAADPTHEVVRQTYVALLLEAKRTDAAATALQEGLAINPANTGFAVLLARISVERGDLDGALALLKRHEASAQNNAEYHAFVAALYQRGNRHGEAIEQYETALRLTSTVGAWWIGLGISQEAAGRPKDAAASFRRGKATGGLNEELVAYVDRRLKQIQ